MSQKKKICPICKKNKTTEYPYCNEHMQAKQALKMGYEHWLKAYGVLSWEDYLKRLLELGDQVGKDVQAVAEYERFFKL
ncbi:MAG: hypothetical protein ACTSQE_10570 [Candidatus Heimdallarchaeaceae archaeon]